MGSDHHHLRRVGEEAFGVMDQLYGQSISSSSYRQQRPYVYGGPQAVTVVQEPNAYIRPDQVHTKENKTAGAYSYQVAPEVFRVTKAAPMSNTRRSVQIKAEEQPGLNCQDAARMFGGIRICEHLNFRANPHKI